MAYRDIERQLPVVASERGVGSVLEPLSVGNLLDLQADIAGRVADALSTTLSPADSSAITELRTSDLMALELYCAERQRWRQRDEAGLTRAVELLRESIGWDSPLAGS